MKLGFVAVPQLTDALGDPTPTRSVGYGRDFVFSDTILPVGDCAEAVLTRIAGESLYFSLRKKSPYLSDGGAVEEIRQLVREWWNDVQTDELDGLERGLRRGEADCFFESLPNDRAVSAGGAGSNHASDPRDRRRRGAGRSRARTGKSRRSGDLKVFAGGDAGLGTASVAGRRIDTIPGVRRPEFECWNVTVLRFPADAKPVDSGGFPRPGDNRTEYQWTRLHEPVSEALGGDLPFEIRGHLYDVAGE